MSRWGLAAVALTIALGCGASKREADDLQPGGTSGELQGFARSGKLIYTFFGTGLRVIDVSNRSAPVTAGRYDVAGTWTLMDLQGDLVTLLDDSGTDGNTRLLVLNVANPKHITLLSDTKLPGLVRDDLVLGDVLYVATGLTTPTPELSAVMLGNPTHVPAPITIPFGSDATYVMLAPGTERIYATSETSDGLDRGAGTTTIQAFDLDGQGAPTLGPAATVSGFVSPPAATATGVAPALDEYAGVLRVVHNGSASSALSQLALPSLTAPSELALPTGPSESVLTARFDGPHAFALTGNPSSYPPALGYTAVDLTDPSSGTVQHFPDLVLSPLSLIGAGGVLSIDWLADTLTLVSLADFSHPEASAPVALNPRTTPTAVGWFEPEQLGIVRSLAMVNMGPESRPLDPPNDTLQLIDTSGTTPAARAAILVDATLGFDVDDHFLFTASPSTLAIYDISIQSSPVLVSELPWASR